MTDLVIAGSTYAFANWGQWKASCPAPYCRSAIDLEPGDTEYACREWGCGARAPVVWPTNVADIEALLLLRPDPITRNWLPGETVHDLLRENLAHGIIPAAWLAVDRGPVLSIVGDHIVSGVLEPTRQRQPIGRH